MIKLIFIFLIALNNLTLPSFSENWFTSAANYSSTKFANIKEINQSNIKNLDIAWIYRNGYIPNKSQTSQNNQATPIFTGNSLILTSLDNFIISINPKNGKENWRTKINSPAGKRGLIYYDGNIYVPSFNGIYVLNEKSGNLNNSFGINGLIGEEKRVSLVPPVVIKDKIFIIYKSLITSHDLPSGKLNWKLNLNGSRVWSGVSFDNKTKTLAFVTSNLVNLIGNTKIENDYSNSIVLVNTITGKTKCKFKDTIHDHWDLDMVGNPVSYTHLTLPTILLV